jgi:glucosamine-6-phosphate deaminase
MHVTVVKDYDEMSIAAAKLAKQIIDDKPNAAVVLAVGNTPMGMYRELTKMKQIGELDTSRLRIFQLDGYLGISKDDPRSLEGWLRRSVLIPWEIPDEHVVALAEDSDDPEEVCREYDQKVQEAGGFDLAVLGLGPNGHLGFNEPPSSPDSPTRVVPLTKASIRSNANYWGSEDHVPKKSITAGMKQLLNARQIILLVSGKNKREILRKTIQGPETDDVPSSHLQLHPNVTIIADKAAWPLKETE